ncbi:MAG: serine protease [Crocinitomicaceae bacterium]|nr:serine protease [Crocinitomicaceae bacterium]|tara:strand:- start:203 stop:2425 length:2223 start_codon:yes stop_codon:yes gene_type:complete
MKRLFSFALIAILFSPISKADEGMWLLHMLKQINEASMQDAGFRLTAEDIYDINNASLKDAILRLNGGSCTAEVISSEGLVLTNHHCAYGAIQGFSSPEHDYLTDGFFAMNKSEEMHIDGFEVSFLVRIEDVTSKILDGITDAMSEDERNAAIGSAQNALVGEMSEADTEGYSYEVKSFYYGNEYYMFVYNTYKDIRLVAAPPESVGKYGGDTDNWMWPRHTGDFSMLRIYADGENNPADYSEDNIPYSPKRHLNISMDGVEQGDFTMIMGYPGSTDRFLSSWGIEQALNLHNPSVVEVRDLKLKTMKKHMDADLAVRIKYAAKYAQTANYWKYYIGQSKGLRALDVHGKKKSIEDQFTAWVNESEERQAEYGEALTMISEFYSETDATAKSDAYALEAGLIGSDITLFAVRFARTAPGLMSENPAEVAGTKVALHGLCDNFYRDYDMATDRDLFVNLLSKYKEDIASELLPSFFDVVDSKFGGNVKNYADAMYSSSILVNEAKTRDYIENATTSTSSSFIGIRFPMGSASNNGSYNLYNDLAVGAAMSILDTYFASFTSPSQDKFDKGYRLFVKGLREMQPDKAFYPDANSTMRLTYGPVGDYSPADAVQYDFITTANGILQKKDNTNPEFVVSDQLEELIENRDFGQYADDSGELVVCFIHGTDITGGNSGSPVMNKNGDLIGLAFDGNWEAMSGDIAFEPQLQRTISVDIRYVLWIVDKFAGATNIIEELDLVYENK